MAQRLLRITAELFVQSFMRPVLTDGPPRLIQVIADPVPADAKVLSVRSSLYWSDTVEIVLESDEWPEVVGPHQNERIESITPVLRTIEQPADSDQQRTLNLVPAAVAANVGSLCLKSGDEERGFYGSTIEINGKSIDRVTSVKLEGDAETGLWRAEIGILP